MQNIFPATTSITDPSKVIGPPMMALNRAAVDHAAARLAHHASPTDATQARLDATANAVTALRAAFLAIVADRYAGHPNLPALLFSAQRLAEGRDHACRRQAATAPCEWCIEYNTAARQTGQPLREARIIPVIQQAMDLDTQ